jgi:hypothetical protein
LKKSAVARMTAVVIMVIAQPGVSYAACMAMPPFNLRCAANLVRFPFA